MLVWLVEDGETLPVQREARRMRTGMLASEFVNRGHSLVWWSSTFSHQRKHLLHETDIEVLIQERFKLALLHAGQYRRNISYQRYRHHCLLAKKFQREAMNRPVPDVIVTGYPIIELAYEAVAYANAHDVPIIVDTRDLWPDIFIDKSPDIFKGVVKTMLRPIFAKTRRVFRNADSIVAVSESYLNWALAQAQRTQTDRDRVFHLGYQEFETRGHPSSKRLESLHPLTEGKTIFTFIGSFGHSYELKLLFEVASRLLKIGSLNIHFVLAGDGEQYEALSQRAKSLPNMTLTGWLDNDEIREILGLSHVGLVPCLHATGSLPNKPFEYLSAGLPILSSLEGEMAEIISTNDVGFSYRRNDILALCDHVINLATNDPLRQRQAANARALFMRKFRANAIYRDYANHVEQIVGRKRLAHDQASSI
jgi:glycosyltransferase involved in cell wall biosynthesis